MLTMIFLCVHTTKTRLFKFELINLPEAYRLCEWILGRTFRCMFDLMETSLLLSITQTGSISPILFPLQSNFYYSFEVQRQINFQNANKWREIQTLLIQEWWIIYNTVNGIHIKRTRQLKRAVRLQTKHFPCTCYYFFSSVFS